MSAGFYFEAGVLAELVLPASGFGKRTPYVHRCQPSTFEEVCHRIDECETFTLEGIVDPPSPRCGTLANSQVALALRFLREYGLIEKIYPKRNRRTEQSIHLSAMTSWHALREGATLRGGASS